MSPSQCPSREELSAFTLGALPEAVLEDMGRHVEVCPACDLALRELDRLSDPVLAGLRRGGSIRQAVPAHALLQSGRLGDFRILREVGRGGMGIVYEALQESLGRHIALKVLLPHAVLDDRSLRRFQQEARSAARLHHSNIVPVFGVGACDGQHYYVMQFIQGLGLDRVLAALRRRSSETAGGPEDCSADTLAGSLLSGVFAPAEASFNTPPPEPTSPAVLSDPGRPYWQSVARIGIQAAEALAYAHTQGVLHRDVKPSNLLVDGQGTVWVTDFGLAKASDSEDLTHSGDVVGTLRYLAPERFAGRVDARSDVYALGLTLYELLTLRPAFDRTGRDELLRQVMHDEPPAPRQVNPSVPRDLQTIVLKAMARDPAHRYRGAAELADDLKRFHEDRPIRARPVSGVEKLWRWCRRNPALALALAAVVLLAVGAFLWINCEKDAARALARDNARLAGEEREAAARATAALAARDTAARRAGAVNDFLVHGMLALADPRRHQGQELTVRAVLDRAAADVGRRFASEPELEEAVRDSLAQAYMSVGEPRKVLAQRTAQVALRRRLHGEGHPLTLAAQAVRITVLVRCDDYSAAVKESTALLPLLRRTLGADHPHTLQLMQDRARALSALNQHADAVPLMEGALAAQRRLHGPQREPALEATREMVLILAGAGRVAEAFRLCEEHLPVCRRILGAEHTITLTMRNQRALCLTTLGRLAEAEAECQALLPLLRNSAGADHLDTLSLTNNLANVRVVQQRHAEACRLFDECLPAMRRRLGEHNLQVLSSAGMQACCLGSLGRLAEAEALFSRVLPPLRKALAPSDPSLLVLLPAHGLVLLKQAHFSRAEPVWAEVVMLRRKKFPQGHHLIGEAEIMRGSALIGQARYPEAERLLLAIHKEMTAGDSPPSAATARSAALFLSILYRKWGKPEQASRWAARASARGS